MSDEPTTPTETQPDPPNIVGDPGPGAAREEEIGTEQAIEEYEAGKQAEALAPLTAEERVRLGEVANHDWLDYGQHAIAGLSFYAEDALCLLPRALADLDRKDAQIASLKVRVKALAAELWGEDDD